MHTDRAVTRKSSELVVMRPDEIIIQILQLQQHMFNLENGVFEQKTCGTQPLESTKEPWQRKPKSFLTILCLLFVSTFDFFC